MGRGRETWDSDRFAQLAVERLLEIVGESARAMSEQARGARPAVPWSDIIGLRSVLADHYHRVNPAQVWSMAAVAIPELASEPIDPS